MNQFSLANVGSRLPADLLLAPLDAPRSPHSAHRLVGLAYPSSRKLDWFTKFSQRRNKRSQKASQKHVPRSADTCERLTESQGMLLAEPDRGFRQR